MNPRRCGFSLIEMLVATMLVAVLMMLVMTLLASIQRDERSLRRIGAADNASHLLDLLRFDLANAEMVWASDSGESLVVIGHGGIDSRTFTATQRMSRVSYQIHREGKQHLLARHQEYLDDPARPEAWTELIGRDFDQIYVVLPTVRGSEGQSGSNRNGVNVSGMSRIRVRLERSTTAIDRELWIR